MVQMQGGHQIPGPYPSASQETNCNGLEVQGGTSGGNLDGRGCPVGPG